MREERVRTGRWPLCEEWVRVDVTGRRPTTPVVVDLFGRWSVAAAAARYNDRS